MTFKDLRKTKLKAITLTELLVVMVIMGILVLLVLPNFQGQVSDAYQQEAKQQLSQIRHLQDTYKMSHFQYSKDFAAIRFQEPSPWSPENEAGAKYEYSILDASETTFRAQAKAVKDFDGDGTYNVLEIDQTGNINEVVPD